MSVTLPGVFAVKVGRPIDNFPWLRGVAYVRAVNYSHRKRGPGRIHLQGKPVKAIP